MESEPWDLSPGWSTYVSSEIKKKYEIFERIGQGAFGEVYRGRRRADGLIVALKHSFHPQSSCREVEAFRRLEHPNILKLLEYFVDGSNFFLILEYLPYNLFVIIESFLGVLGEAEIKGLMVQLLQGVAASHSASILHRDLKPTNLLVANDGTLKIADFGQARKIGNNLETIRSRAEAKDSDQDSAMSSNSMEDNLQKEKHLAKLDLPTRHTGTLDGRLGEQSCPSREEGNHLEGKDENYMKEAGQSCPKKVGDLLEEYNSITESNFHVGPYSQNYDDKKRAETAILEKLDSRFHIADTRSHGNAKIDGCLLSEKTENMECVSHSLSERTLEVDLQTENFCHKENAYHGHFGNGGNDGNSSFPSEEHFFMEKKSELVGIDKGFGRVHYTKSVQKLDRGTVSKVKRTGNKPFSSSEDLLTKCSKNLSEPSDFEHSASAHLDASLCHSYNNQNVQNKLIEQGNIASQIRGCEVNDSFGLNAPVSTGTSEGEHTGNWAAAFEDECVLDLPARNAEDIHNISTDMIDCDGLFLLDLSKGERVKSNDQDCEFHCDPQTAREAFGERETVESSTSAQFDLDGLMESQGISKTKLGRSEAQVHAVSWSAGALKTLSKREGAVSKLSKRKNVEGDTELGTQNPVKSQENFLGSSFSNKKMEDCLVDRDEGDIARFFDGGYARQVTEHGGAVAEYEEEWGILEAGDEEFLTEIGNEAKWYDGEDVLKKGNYSSWFGDLTSASKDYVVRKVPNEFEISERYCELICDGSWLGNKSENHCSSVICSPVTHSRYMGSDKRLHTSELKYFQSNCTVSVDDANDLQIQDDRMKPEKSHLAFIAQRFEEAGSGNKNGTRGFMAFDGVHAIGSKPSLQPDEREESILSILDPRLHCNKSNGLECTHNQDCAQFLDKYQGYDSEEEGTPVVSSVEKNCHSIDGSVISQGGFGQAFSNQLCCCSSCLKHRVSSITQMASRNEEEFQDLTWNMYSSSKPPLSGQTSIETDGSLLDLTGCVGTRWYRAPELLYGCKSYGTGIDIWAVGCIFGELLAGQPLFPGSTDIDQLSRVIRILGVPKEENWPGVSKLADYNKISFDDNCVPLGLEEILPSASEASRRFLSKLFVYDPEKRLSAEEALKDEYFLQDPSPVVPRNFPALTERHLLGQEDWHEWKEPCSSSSDFEVLDFAGY